MSILWCEVILSWFDKLCLLLLNSLLSSMCLQVICLIISSLFSLGLQLSQLFSNSFL